jgi:uncharacterized protein YxeA
MSRATKILIIITVINLLLLIGLFVWSNNQIDETNNQLFKMQVQQEQQNAKLACLANNPSGDREAITMNCTKAASRMFPVANEKPDASVSVEWASRYINGKAKP